jgi:hypothetical protein
MNINKLALPLINILFTVLGIFVYLINSSFFKTSFLASFLFLPIIYKPIKNLNL